MNRKNGRYQLYMEAGLAVLLVITLALAGMRGLLSAHAESSESQTAAEASSDDGVRLMTRDHLTVQDLRLMQEKPEQRRQSLTASIRSWERAP